MTGFRSSLRVFVRTTLRRPINFDEATMPVRKRQGGPVARKGGDHKKKRQDTTHEKHEGTDADNFFMDDEEGAPPPDEEGPEEVAETAEQKRLRLGPLTQSNLGSAC